MLSAFRYLFDLRDEGFYRPLALPPLPTLGARAARIDTPEFPRLTEITRFILGDRAVAVSGGGGGGGTASASWSERALCMPPAA